jgi:hypothetical protein
VPDTTTTAAPTTTTAPTTTAAPTTTEFVESDTACGNLAPLQSTARAVISAPIDWEGSGAADYTALLYETAPDTADYRLRVEREGVGSEIAIVMSPEASAAANGPGEPAIIAAVQVDGSGDGVQPQELLVRIGTVPRRKVDGKQLSGGFDVTVYFRNTGQGLPEVGCLARFADATGAELVLPIRSGGAETSGLACDLQPDGAGGFFEYLVRTTAAATDRRREYSTRDIRLERTDVRATGTSPTSTTEPTPTSAPTGVPGSDAVPTTSSTVPFVPVRVGGALVDGETTTGRESDYQSPTSPFLRYTEVTGCSLDIETIPND